MADTTNELIEAARHRLVTRRGVPDYSRLAESFRRQTLLDSRNQSWRSARFRTSLGLSPPRPPTLQGKILSRIGDVFSPILWRLLRAAGSADPLEATYEMAICQMEWQLDAERRTAEELASIRARLDALETALNDRRESS